MPRTENIIERYRASRSCLVEVVDSFTLRCTLPSGTILRGDGERLWSNGRATWSGKEPEGWGSTPIVEERHTIRRELEVNYS